MENINREKIAAKKDISSTRFEEDKNLSNRLEPEEISLPPDDQKIGGEY